MDLFDLLGKIAVNMSGFDNAMDRVKSETRGVQQNLTGVSDGVNRTLKDSSKSLTATLEENGKKMTQTAKTMTIGATTPIVATMTAMTNTAMDFEAKMDRVGAISGATATEMDAMTESAMKLGASTSKSASEVAVGMENMAAMGFDANEIIGAMPGIISAAEASGADMAQTADVVAASLNIWGMEASKASKVADILAQTANQSAADITDMQYALKYAGPPGAALGVTLEELSASIGIMTKENWSVVEKSAA